MKLKLMRHSPFGAVTSSCDVYVMDVSSLNLLMIVNSESESYPSVKYSHRASEPASASSLTTELE